MTSISKAQTLQIKRKLLIRENSELLLLALPGLVFLAIFHYWPMFGIVIAFQDFNPAAGIFGSPWNGLDNFRFFFTSLDAARTIGNTVRYSLTFLALDLICAVALALALYSVRSVKAIRVYNTLMILPRFMSMVLIAFIVFVVLSPSAGVANQLRGVFGGKPIQWYNKAEYWPVILTLTHIWSTVGMNSIIYYATLMGIDESLFEAAMLDGACKRHQIIHVAIPHLVPIMVITTILGIGHLFSGDFGLFYQVPKNIGLLYKTTDIINTYTFRALVGTGGGGGGELEKSAAVGLFQSLMGMILVIMTNLAVRKISPENSLF